MSTVARWVFVGGGNGTNSTEPSSSSLDSVKSTIGSGDCQSIWSCAWRASSTILRSLMRWSDGLQPSSAKLKFVGEFTSNSWGFDWNIRTCAKMDTVVVAICITPLARSPLRSSIPFPNTVKIICNVQVMFSVM